MWGERASSLASFSNHSPGLGQGLGLLTLTQRLGKRLWKSYDLGAVEESRHVVGGSQRTNRKGKDDDGQRAASTTLILFPTLLSRSASSAERAVGGFGRPC